MEDSELKIQWLPAATPAKLVGPFRIETKENKMGTTLHPGVIVIHCSWGCLRVDNVPEDRLEELAQNFLVLAEARYGNT